MSDTDTASVEALAAEFAQYKFTGQRLDNAAAMLRSLAAERDEDQAVIAVWRGRTERAEAERDALARRVAELESTLALQQASYEREIRIEVEAERAACESLCEEIADGYQSREAYTWPEMKTDAQTGAHDCAAGIRARNTPKEPT